MKSPLFSLPALALLLALGMAHAQAADCAKASTQAEMTACASQTLTQADADLNANYLAYRAKLDKARQNQIRDVQLAWLKYRDLSCRFESSASAGGSAASLALQTCLADKTRQRADEIKALAGCQEGDLNCVR
ncbi:lysozyme inhibitor LprI family protein [Herbaspirillum sp. NPDC087042]|uniref:lysozyme inhibitor LprI family protein n=1 Tax=Herbaspirillum sp. NPDC087042 TaxID=3364004 RepID=UPI0038018404